MFEYDDRVRVLSAGINALRLGAVGNVVAIISDRDRFPLPQFPPGIVYSVEFEGGELIDFHEAMIELA